MKKMHGKNREKEVTIESLNRKTKQQMIMLLTAGIIMIFVDLMISSGNRIQLVESYGQLYMIRPEAGEDAGSLTLYAEIQGKAQDYEKKINVVLEPYDHESGKQKEAVSEERTTMSEQEQLEYQIRNVADDFNSDKSVRKIRLPERLDTGERIIWHPDNTAQTNTIVILVLMMVSGAALYRNRMAPIRKRRQENLDSITRQLPEFVNRLVLLLNAGLVLNSAFERCIEESMAFNRQEEEYFIARMKDIYLSVKTANGSMHREFRRFARESGSRELMRISNIINDNVDKGVGLTQKLQNESELLWMNRKKNCEEKGRLAETKLTLPLVIFLMVLVVITVAPALLEL